MTRYTSPEFNDEPEYTFGTKCDRNTPFESSAERKRKAHDEYDARMMNYMAEPTPKTERSLRYNSGKPDYSLIPIAAMQEAAKVLEYGASKYERDNWKRPTHWSVSFACLQRHLAAWQSGEDLDPESGRNHLGHAMCNILQMLHMLENHPEELKR
jgi:hypothetical protein